MARLLFLLLMLTPTSLFAQQSSADCTRALIMDRGRLDVRDWSSVALIRLFDQASSNGSNTSAGLSVPIDGLPFSGSFEDARQSANHTIEQSALAWSQERLVSIATQTLSDNAVRAYQTCIGGQQRTGPVITVHDATRTEATVTVRWNAPSNAGQTARVPLHVQASGGSFPLPFPETVTTGAAITRILRRAPNADIRLIASVGEAGNEDSDDEFVSRLPDPPIIASVDTIGLVLWGGAHDMRGNDCNTPNPATGQCSCPPGYQSRDMVDAGMTMCFALRSATVSTRFLFGGAYDPSGDRCVSPNPLTGQCSCPTGYRVLDLSDAGFHMCYAPAAAAPREYLMLGGSYDPSGDRCSAGNLALNGACGCPDGYPPLDLVDAGLVICRALPPRQG
jgi:hypothetical protein